MIKLVDARCWGRGRRGEGGEVYPGMGVVAGGNFLRVFSVDFQSHLGVKKGITFEEASL